MSESPLNMAGAGFAYAKNMKKLNLIWIIALFFIALLPNALSLGYDQSCIGVGNPSDTASNYTKSYLNNLTEKYFATAGVARSFKEANLTGGNDVRLNSSANIDSGTCIETSVIEDYDGASNGGAVLGFFSQPDGLPTANGDHVGIFPSTAFAGARKIRVYDNQGANDASVDFTGLGPIVIGKKYTYIVCIQNQSFFSAYIINETGQRTIANTSQTFIATTAWINVLTGTVASTKTNYSNVTVYNHTSGCPQSLADVSDTTPPVVNASLNNTSPKINEVINFSANITDETGLLFVNITYNMSGILTKLNYSVSGTSVFISNTTAITAGRGSVINFTFFATDTSNNVKINNTIITVADTLGSIRIGLNLSTIKINNVINISGNITEADGNIAYGWIVINQTSNINYTFAGSGTMFNFSQNTTISVGRGNVINFSVFYNDTYGTQFQNSTLITIANTIPNGTNFVNITGKHYNRNITRLNWTPSDNPDNDVLRYIVFSDTSNPPVALYYNGTNLNISTNWTSDNTYFYQIKVMDEISESALSPVFNLTLDTGLPTLTANCTNNTFTRLNLTCLFSIEDPFPYNLSVLVNRNGNDYHIKTNSTANGRFINMTFLMNLTEDGNYTIYVNGSDSDKTSPRIDDTLTRSKKGEAEYVMNDTLNNIAYKMLIRFEDKNENELATPTDYKSYANYNSKGTHIDFGMNFTSNKNIIIPVYEVNTKNVNIAVLNDSIEGHLVWFPYGTDFEGRLLVNGIERNYSVNVKILTSTRVKISIIPATDIMNNDVVQFRSESVFGLNLIDITNTYVKDTIAPTFVSAYNRTTSGNSTSITTATSVDTCIEGLDDLYLDRGNFSHNASGVWTNQSMTIAGNKTRYCNTISSNNFISNQIVGWKFYVYDIAGNELDPIYTFSVGSVPSATPTTSLSGGSGGGAIGATRQCREYSLVYKNCYYFDGINQCLKGCPKGQSCNSTYECVGQVTSTQITLLQSPLSAVKSPISRFFELKPLQQAFNWFKGLLGLSKKNPELSLYGGSTGITEGTSATEQPIAQQATQSFENLKQKTSLAFEQHKWLPYAIIGVVIAGFGIYVFGLWQAPLALIIGLGTWGYILIFILLIITYLFFKYF